MSWSKINNASYKIVAGIIGTYLFLGGIAMCLHTLYVKGLIGIVAGAIVGILFMRQPFIINWFQILALLFAAMYIVGGIK